MECEFAKI